MVKPIIQSFRFGRIVIDGQEYTQDVIILPDCVLGNWWRKEGHVLHAEDLEAVIKAAPDVLVVGKGTFNRMRITSKTEEALKEARIELWDFSTEEACQIYNQEREKRRVAAALHLTC